MKYLALFLIILLVAPVSAVTYSPEYYALRNQSNQWSGSSVEGWGIPGIGFYTGMSALELKKQSILMERQNEILDEQNALLREILNKTRSCE